MLVSRPRRRQLLQPRSDILDQPIFIVIHIDRRGNMHRRNKTQPILNPAAPHNLLHLRSDMDHLIPLVSMESQIFGMCFYRCHKTPFSTANGTECKFSYLPSSMSEEKFSKTNASPSL